MASGLVRQDRFDGGEIAPTWYGRTDDPRYGISLRTCKNFLPIQHGALVNRSGLMYVGAPRAPDPKYKAFVFSDAQTFVLEFSAGFVRFWTNGGQVLDGGGNPVEVVTPYAQGDLQRLKFAQSGDVVRIDHPSYQPRDLTRLSNTNWTLALSSFTPPAYFAGAPIILSANFPTEIHAGAVSSSTIYAVGTTYGYGDIVLYVTGGQVHLYQSVVANNLGNQPDTSPAQWLDWEYGAAKVYAAGDYVWDHLDQRLYVSLADNNVAHTPSASATYWQPALDATRPPKSWQWVVTIVYRDAIGRNVETLASAPTADIKVALYTDRTATIFWGAPVPPAFSYQIQFYNVYRGRNGIFGFIGNTQAGNTRTFRDDGQAPNFAIQPPRGTNPFTIADGADTANTTKWPGAVTFHESRCVHARSDAKPNHFFGSRQDDFGNFDVNFPVQATDAYDFGIASQELEEIRSIVSLRHLLMFTGQGEFSAEGAPGSAITPNSIRVKRHSRYGSSYLDPVLVGNAAIFNTAKGNYVRDLVYSWQTDSYDGGDLTIFGRHLFENHTIVDWCFAEVPYKVLWAVRDDGVLLSCTYDRGTQTLAWAQHPTQGQARRVCSVPEGTEDVVYVLVVRDGSYCFERMASRILPRIANGVDPETGLTKYRDDVRFCVFLDASKTFDGRNVSAITMKVTGASFNADDLVTVEASVASFAGTDVGDQVVMDPDGTPTRMTVTAFTDTTHVTARLEAPLPPAFQNFPTVSWGWARDTLTGFAHLEAQSVTVLADGVVQGPFVVTGGQVALTLPALIATAGLAYNSDAELLDLSASSIKSNVKAVVRMIWEVISSRSFLTGEAFDKTLRPTKLKKVTDNFGAPALVTDQVQVPIESSWNTGARAVIRQADPLPLTVIGAIREVEVGGR